MSKSSSSQLLLIPKSEVIAIIKKYGYSDDLDWTKIPELLQNHAAFWNKNAEESAEVFKERTKPEARLQNICAALDDIANHLLSLGVSEEKLRVFIEKDGVDGLLRASLKQQVFL